jgi:glycosyltransferase involved in cell wall biosynthesis
MKAISNMRILLIVVYYPPHTMSAAHLMRDLAREYVLQGHQVMVVTPSDSILTPKSVIIEDGVTVVRVRTGAMKNANKILRLWRESQLSVNIWRNAREVFQKNPCDLIVFYSPTIFFGHLVKRLKTLWNCPAYLILRDIFPQWAVDAGILRKGGVLHRFLRHNEIAQYAAADIIGVEARGNLSYFNEDLRQNKFHVEILNNWISEQINLSSTACWRKKLGLDDKVVFCYGGNIGVAQDVRNILRLATGLRERDDIFFLLIGDGNEVQQLNLEIDRLDLNNIKILPAMPEREYMHCLSECDVGLVSLARSLRSHNCPGKVLGYISCGKPILASLNPDNDLIALLLLADAGIACTNGDDDELHNAAVLLANEPLVRQRMGKNARLLSDTTFSVHAIAKQILSHFVIAPDREMPVWQSAHQKLSQKSSSLVENYSGDEQ